MNVVWTDNAVSHLDSIYAYVAQNSPEYALDVIDRITRRSRQIAAFSLSGRRVPEYDVAQVREVYEAPYRIIYHIAPDQIEIIAVLHASMNVLTQPQTNEL